MNAVQQNFGYVGGYPMNMQQMQMLQNMQRQVSDPG